MKRFDQRRIGAYENGMEPHRSDNFYNAIGFMREFGSTAGIAARGAEGNWER